MIDTDDGIKRLVKPITRVASAPAGRFEGAFVPGGRFGNVFVPAGRLNLARGFSPWRA